MNWWIGGMLIFQLNFELRSGIFSSDPLCPACTSTSCPTNHAVVIVGYGTATGIDFWIGENLL